MPCSVDISSYEEVNHYQVLLCKAFKFLSKEQIASVTNPGSGICDGINWYSQHLMLDYSKKCHNEDVLNFDHQTSEQEKKAILKELNRIGYDLLSNSTSIALVELHE